MALTITEAGERVLSAEDSTLSAIARQLQLLRTAPASEHVDTRRVMGRRRPRYESFQDLIQDIRQVRAGNFRTIGNWSLGQILEHLAAAMHMSIDGVAWTVPWYLRIAARLFYRRRLIRGPIAAGIKLPAAAARLTSPEFTAVEAGLESLERAIERLQNETDRAPHPFIGELSLQEWDSVQLRHAELHMSFVVCCSPSGLSAAGASAVGLVPAVFVPAGLLPAGLLPMGLLPAAVEPVA